MPSAFNSIVQLEYHDKAQLPLASARNFGVSNASCEDIIFLDVDCIPDADLLGCYLTAFKEPGILWSGRIRYLGKDAMDDRGVWDQMAELSMEDPVRGKLDHFAYENFWSLNFGCSKSTFQRIGGFDEGYIGYGAEDTDFAFRARAEHVIFKTIDATAYHQYHPSYDPPLNHFEAIIANATTFYQKWNIWPMDGWLRKFEQMGLISTSENQISITRLPNQGEIDWCLKRH